MPTNSEVGSWTLRRWADWYLEDGETLRVDPPDEDALRVTYRSSEMILYREPPFQAVLVMLFPGHHIPPHHHPNVDSYDISLSGSGNAIVAGRSWTKSSNYKRGLTMRIPVLAGVVHSGYTESGAAFLSLQKWKNGVAPSFLCEDWQGCP